MKVKQTGSIDLSEDLLNKHLWKAIINGSLAVAYGKVYLPLENGNIKDMLFAVNYIIPKGEIPLQFFNEINMAEIFQQDSQKQNLIIGEAFVHIFHGIVSESSIIMGNIIGSLGELTPILILYFEPFGQFWYNVLDLEQKSVLEKFTYHQN